MDLRAVSAIAFIAASVLSATADAQTTLYVDNDGVPANGCTSWADACPELQTALSLAADGDQIWVAVGTYTADYDVGEGTHTGDREATFQLISGVAIYGGFDGTEKTLEERAGQFDETILSGDLNEDDAPNESDCCEEHPEPGCDEPTCEASVCAADPECCDVSWDQSCALFASNLCLGVCGGLNDNSYHVVTFSESDSTAAIDGLSMTAGNADASTSPDDDGAGMYIVMGSLAVANCLIFDNSAAGDGGGMYNGGDGTTVRDCTFRGNAAQSFGGGLFNAGGATGLTVTNCEFSGNRAGPTGNNGGGIYNVNAAPVISGCTFVANMAGNSGGAIYNNNGPAVVTLSHFSENVANKGGAIFANFGNLTVASRP